MELLQHPCADTFRVIKSFQVRDEVWALRALFRPTGRGRMSLPILSRSGGATHSFHSFLHADKVMTRSASTQDSALVLNLFEHWHG